MSIVCDGKHDKAVEAMRSLRIRGETKIGDDTVRIEFRMQVREKEYCEDCMLGLVKKVNLTALIKDAQKAQQKKMKRTDGK